MASKSWTYMKANIANLVIRELRCNTRSKRHFRSVHIKQEHSKQIMQEIKWSQASKGVI